MGLCKVPLALVLLFVSVCVQSEAQLLANIKSFLSNVPTFGSKDVPKFSTDGQYVPSRMSHNKQIGRVCIKIRHDGLMSGGEHRLCPLLTFVIGGCCILQKYTKKQIHPLKIMHNAAI